MKEEKDLYKQLNVDPEADPDVITAAFRALSKKLHPELDFTGIQEYRLAELKRAYKVLHDPAERKAYDQRRAVRMVALGPGEPEYLDGGDTPSHLAERVKAVQDAADAPDERRLDFGRYAGQTLREIARQDKDYLRWLARHSSGIRYRTAILKILGERVYSVRPSR